MSICCALDWFISAAFWCQIGIMHMIWLYQLCSLMILTLSLVFSLKLLMTHLLSQLKWCKLVYITSNVRNLSLIPLALNVIRFRATASVWRPVPIALPVKLPGTSSQTGYLPIKSLSSSASIHLSTAPSMPKKRWLFPGLKHRGEEEGSGTGPVDLITCLHKPKSIYLML